MAKQDKKTTVSPNTRDIRRRIQAPERQLYRIITDLRVYRNAVLAAENPITPNRFQLLQVYNMVQLDAHLSAAMQQRKNLTLGREFCVFNPDGKENEEKTKLIRKKWFRDFLDMALDSLFWGHSLSQFDSIININGDDEFKCVDLVPRIYVKPEFHIVTNDTSAVTGTDYLDMPWANWVIGVGKSRDLGLLLKAAPLVIWKKNAFGAWSEFVEKFGNPTRIGKTNVRDEATRSNMDNYLKQMSVAGYAVIDTDDLIELVETKQQDAFNVFDMMIQRVNSEISKLILGQTSTLEEKSFVGSAEVHERVLQGYAYLDEQLINSVLNYQLLPMLNAHGFGFEGLSIAPEAEDAWDLTEKSAFDIALINSGKFKLTPEYIKEKYGTEVMAVEEQGSESGSRTVKNKLDELYR